MRRLALTIVLAISLGACAAIPRAPEFQRCQTPARTTFQQCGASEFEGHTQLYMQTFEEVWAETPWLPQNPGRLHAAFQLVDLHWQAWVFSQPHGSPRLYGLTYPIIGGRHAVFCAKLSDKLEHTSLGHELMHIAYGATAGDLVADHFTGLGWWPSSVEEFLHRVGQRYREKVQNGAVAVEGLRIQR